MRIERLGPDDVVRLAAAEWLFDDAIDAEMSRAFLADDRHHLLVAYDGEAPTGFVTGVELLHPDKPGPEMFLYELGVDEAFRGRGIGRALVEALAEFAWKRGCYAVWVLTDDANAAATATYRAAGGNREPESVMFVWDRPETATPRRSR
jgi:ribosomal protein S18 acetylase RimI-like enzyme